MKRLLVIMLVALLLCGCGAGADTTGADTTESILPEAVGLYNPNSKAEVQTGGAVRAYPLGSTTYAGLTTIGSKRLLIAESGELTLLTGDLCEIVATMVTGVQFTQDLSGLAWADTGVAYYNQTANEVVLLNPQLQESGRYPLPQELQGKPVISVAKNEVFYSTGPEICAINMQSRISRKVRIQENSIVELTGCYFDGQVLSCKVQNGNEQPRVLYISTETGQTLSEEQGISLLVTEGDRYYLERMDGYVQQRIVGTTSKTPISATHPGGHSVTGTQLSVRLFEGTYSGADAALKQNGIVSFLTEEKGVRFAFNDISTSTTVAQMLLPQVDAPIAIAADSQYIWVIAAHAGTNKQVLYRWDTSMSDPEENVFVVEPLYTAQNPDVDRLKLMQEHVDWYNELHGVRIAIWENAVKQTGVYTVTAEHQPDVIGDMLVRLEPVFTMFPDNFLRKTVENGYIRICFVRSIEDGSAWRQFWDNGSCYILMTPKADMVNDFLQAVSYAVDTHVLGNSRDYDNWGSLNPEGFDYDYSYDLYENREDNSLTEGEKRAFIDSFSMTYPHEDRCRVFYYAITEGNEELFASKFMQNKLQKLCEGIREAYGLEKQEDRYAWEQYLVQEMDFSYT